MFFEMKLKKFFRKNLDIYRVVFDKEDGCDFWFNEDPYPNVAQEFVHNSPTWKKLVSFENWAFKRNKNFDVNRMSLNV
jgi:hypothetical protein